MAEVDVDKALNAFKSELKIYWEIVTKAPAPKSIEAMVSELKDKLLERKGLVISA